MTGPMPWEMPWQGASAGDASVPPAAAPWEMPWQPSSGPKTAADHFAGARQKVDAATTALREPITAGSIGYGMREPIDAGAQLLTRSIESGANYIAPGSDAANWATGQRQNVEDINQQALAGYTKSREGKGEFDTGRLFGNMLPMLGPTDAIAGLLPAEARLLPRIGVNAATGATAGALTPVQEPREDFWGQKGKQMAIGAGAGVGMMPFTGAAASVVSPKASTDPNVQKLIGEGVSLMPGQMSPGPAGVFRWTEDKLSSLPVLGDAIRGAQMRGLTSLNRVTVNRVLDPLGERLPAEVTVGRDAVEYAQQKVGAAYDDLLPKLKVAVDPQYGSDLTSLYDHVKSGGMEPKLAQQFDTIIKNKVLGKFADTGTMDGITFKAMESDLGKLAKDYLTSTDGGQRQLGSALLEAQAQVRQLLERSNPEAAGQLSKINQAWGNLTILERAAAGAEAAKRGGVFTSSQLSGAVKAGDSSVRDRKFAAGNARMQDLSDAAVQTMPQVVPNSGTTDRALVNLLALFSAHAAHPMAVPGILGAASLYTPPVQKLMTALLARRPAGAAAAAQGIVNASPYAGSMAANTVNGLLGGI